MKDPKNVLLAVLGAILIGGVGFYGGMLYQKGKVGRLGSAGNLVGRPSGAMLRGGGQNLPTMGNRGMGFRPVVGEILSKDDKSITVKLVDGSSKIVLFSQTTSINKAEQVDATALVAGETVRIFGMTNPDGSVTAQDIQLNPEQAQRGQNLE